MYAVAPLQSPGKASTTWEPPGWSPQSDSGVMYVKFYSLLHIDNGLDASNRPTIPTKLHCPNSRPAWMATAGHQIGNFAEPAGFLTATTMPLDAPQDASTSSTPLTQVPTFQPHLHPCRYTRGHSPPCDFIVTAKHWVFSHVLDELNLIRNKKLALSKAKILTSPEKVKVASSYFVPCPYGCVIKGTQKARTFTRRDRFERHLKASCIVRFPKEMASKIARDVMEKDIRSSPEKLAQRLKETR